MVMKKLRSIYVIKNEVYRVDYFQGKESFVLQGITSFEAQTFLWDIGSLMVIF